MLTIGKLAQETGVSTDTLRYYEKEGLFEPSSKSASGYRLYDEQAARKLRFIKQAQLCGFSLLEIRELLALRESSEACCSDIRSVAVQKKLQLEHKIRALQFMSQALSELITRCNDTDKPMAECPILEALESSMEKRMKGKSRG